MGRLMSVLTDQVVMQAKPHGQEETAARLFRLARPLVAIFDGQGSLASQDEVPYQGAVDVVLSMFGVEPTPDNEAQINLVSYPLSRLDRLPATLFEYRLHFMHLVATELERASEAFGRDVMEATFEDVKAVVCTDLFRLWVPQLAQAHAHFEPRVFLMVGQSYLAVLAMACRYASLGNVEMMSRIAPALRFMGRVIPIGFASGGSYELLALHRD